MRAKLITAAEAASVVLFVGGAFVLSLAFGSMVVGAVLFAGARLADS